VHFHYLSRNRQGAPGPVTIGRGINHNRRESVMNNLLANYLACWNETDPEARRALIAQYWSPQPSYTARRSQGP
jgi:hypothetical protein